MKKYFLILLSLAVCNTVFAEEFSTVCANHILVSDINDVLYLKNQIKDFDDFQSFAKSFSKCPSSQNGGSLGCFQRGQMVKPFEEAAFSGNTGEVIGPVKTEWGYHLIWVTDKY